MTTHSTVYTNVNFQGAGTSTDDTISSANCNEGDLIIIHGFERSGNTYSSYSISDNNSGTWTLFTGSGSNNELGDLNARHASWVWYRTATSTDASSGVTITVSRSTTAAFGFETITYRPDSGSYNYAGLGTAGAQGSGTLDMTVASRTLATTSAVSGSNLFVLSLAVGRMASAVQFDIATDVGFANATEDWGDEALPATNQGTWSWSHRDNQSASSSTFSDSYDSNAAGIEGTVSVLVFEDDSGSTNHALTSADVTLPSITIDSTTFKQEHDLSATELQLSAPTFESTTIGQTHKDTTPDLNLDSVVYDTPTANQQVEFTATALDLPAVTFDSPTLSQKHVFSNADITLSPVVFDSVSITQKHVLTASELTLGGVTVTSPSMGGELDLTATELTLTSVSFDTPLLGHSLTATGLTLPSVTYDSTTFKQEHNILGFDTSLSSVTFDTVNISQGHNFPDSSITFNSVVFDSPTMQDNDPLTGSDVTLSGTTFDSPVFRQTHIDTPADLTLSPVAFDGPTLGVNPVFTDCDLTLTSVQYDAPTLSQKHEIVSQDLNLTSVDIATPQMGYNDGTGFALLADSLTLQPVQFGIPAPGLNTHYQWIEEMVNRYPSNMTNRKIHTESWPHLEANEYAFPGMQPAAVATQQLTANTMIVCPFFLPIPIGLTSAHILVSTADAGSTTKLALYEWDHVNNELGDVLGQTAAASTAGLGVVNFTDADIVDDYPAAWYAWAIVSDGTPSLKYVQGPDEYIQGNLNIGATVNWEGVTHYTAPGAGVVTGTFGDAPTVTAIEENAVFWPHQFVGIKLTTNPAL